MQIHDCIKRPLILVKLDPGGSLVPLDLVIGIVVVRLDAVPGID